MRNQPSQGARRLWPLYLACYTLWLALSALGVVMLFQARAVIFAIAVRLGANPWVIRAIDNFGVVTLGLIWLVCILLLEDRLRKGVVQNRVWGRAARVFVIEMVMLAGLYAAQLLLA
jgi:hypothetical protein